MRQYETAFLIAPNLPEEETEKLILKMADVVSKKKGKMINLDQWGKRKLAYPIKKFEEAFYVFFQYEGQPEITAELERRFRQTEAIIRYLTVKKEPKENIRRKKRVVSKGEGKEVEPEEEEFEKQEEMQEQFGVEETEEEEK